MNDKSALLGQLKIDRGAPAPASGAGKWVVVGLAAVGVAIGGYLWFKPEPPVPVRLATAISAASAAGAGSVLDASGYVVARRQAVVSSKVTGKVIELLIEEGRPVKQGDVLARIDSSNARAQQALSQSQLDASRAAQAEIKVQLMEAERQLRRTVEMHEKKLVSDAALDNAQANADAFRARLDSAKQNVEVAERGLAVQNRLVDDTVVRAPFDGVITTKNAQVGEMISPLGAGGAGTRTGIGTLVDMGSLEIEVDVNENFINRVQPGQPVAAVLNAYPDWKVPASVIAVIPTADRSKATVKVRIAIQDRDARIIPDMGVRVSFLPEDKPQAEAPRGVYIPAEAVRDDGGTKIVFVVRNEVVERRAVTLGATRGTDVQVLGGLAGGDVVAVGELEKLTDGAKVEVAK